MNKAPAGLVFTGGAGGLPGLDLLGAEVLSMPSRVGNPEVIFGFPDAAHTAGFATPLGALNWGLKQGAGSQKNATSPKAGKVFSLNGHRPSLREVYQKMIAWTKKEVRF